MAKKSKKLSKALAAAGRPGSYRIPGTTIEPLETYTVAAVHPPGAGPWSTEADKIAWIDADTELPCIMRRGEDGALRGYVGVGPGHPFFGMRHDALPHDPGLTVHGGVDYAEPCDEQGPPAMSVCHVHDLRQGHAADEEKGLVRLALPAQLWWFGFSCNHTYDLVPGAEHYRELQAETGRVYRDQTYVAREIADLAAQLHAIDIGQSLPPSRRERPPVGLDPHNPRDRA